jgi:type IV secretion system protein VirB11
VSAAAHSIYLESCLDPLASFLARAEVTDIYINRPAEIWVECLGGQIETHQIPALTAELLLRLARQVAASTAQGVSREHPLLAASLPDGARIQVILPPATRGDIAIAIRKHVVSALSLEEYQAGGGFAEAQITIGAERTAKAPLALEASDPLAMLRQAVHSRRNILISGGTSSGKTTFLNSLLREIPAHERLILIEDTPELQVTQPNMVGLIAARGSQGEAEVRADDLLIAALRMRPDRIILGEIRGHEAVTFLRAVNTGHPGSLSTIHADSPLRAIDQLALLVLQTGMRMSWDDVVTYVRRSLDVIVQLRHGAGQRGIDAIYVVGE